MTTTNAEGIRMVAFLASQRIKEHFEHPAVQAGIQAIMAALPAEPATGFDKYIAEALGRGDYESVERMTGERRMARALVDTIIERGYPVSVNDSEEWVVKQSTDKGEIMGALSSTDEDGIYVANPEKPGHYLAWFRLIYGNSGWEVVSDYSDNDLGNAIWKEVLSPLADKIEAGI